MEKYQSPYACLIAGMAQQVICTSAEATTESYNELTVEW